MFPFQTDSPIVDDSPVVNDLPDTLESAGDTAASAVGGATESVSEMFQMMKGPIGGALDGAGAFIPKLIGAILVLVVGWVIARIARWAVSNVLTKSRIGSRLSSLTNQQSSNDDKAIGKTGGKVAYYTIGAFVVLAALKTLGLDNVSTPIADLINQFFAFIPNIVGAGILLALFGFIGNIAGKLIGGGLSKVGFNSIVDSYLPDDAPMETDYAQYAGSAVKFIILMMGLTQAVDTLGLEVLSNFVAQLWGFVVPVLVGTGIILAAVLGAGKLKDMAALFIKDEKQKAMFEMIIFYGVIGLGAMVGLRQMGLVDTIMDRVVPIAVACIGLGLALRYAGEGKKAITELLPEPSNSNSSSKGSEESNFRQSSKKNR